MDAIVPLLQFGLHTRFADLPTSVVERVKRAVLDTLAATVAGSRGDGTAAISELALEWGGAPQATILANGRKVPLPTAVLVNGVAGRAWDLDDVHEQNTCHTSVNVIAPVLALAEARGPLSGADVIAAVAIGCETICRIAAAPRISFSTTGASLSYQTGFFGAALVASRLLCLTPEQAHHALGIAYARIAGNQQGFIDGAMTLRLMQGVAPEGGVLSALFAERGFTGSREVLEGRFGYFHVHHRGAYAREALLDGLGQQWRLEEISIKPVYPCCKYTHGPIEATVQAMAAGKVTASEIASIEATVSIREVYDLVCQSRERKWNPQSVTDAQFSLPFTVCHAAVHGGFSLRAAQPEALADVEVRSLLPRFHARLTAGDQGDGRGQFPMPGEIAITLHSGRRLEHRVLHVKGHPANPMSFDDVAEKFRDCARFAGLDEGAIEQTVDMVARLERLDDAGALARLLGQAQAAMSQ